MENLEKETPEIFSQETQKKIIEANEKPVKYSPDDPPWGSLSALLLWVISVILIIVFPMLFVIPYLFGQGINLSDQEAVTNFIINDPNSILLQIFAVLPAHIITLVAAYFIVTKNSRYSFTEMLGWDWDGLNWWQILLGTITILIIVMLIGLAATSVFGEQENELEKILKSSRYVVFLVAIMATFSAPIVEEVVYRGVLYSAFQRAFSIPVAVFLVTAVFAAVHFPQYWGDHATIITLTALSLLITLIRVKTGSLLPCIFFHFVFNGLQSLMLIFEPYLSKTIGTT